MFSSEVACTSPEALLHGQELSAIWHSQWLTQKFSKAANAALYEVRTLMVWAEHTLDSIAEHFDIHPFQHHIMNRNLVGCLLTLYPQGHLEIKRPGEKYATSFPVFRRSVIAA
jgi:hypothetical protein